MSRARFRASAFSTAFALLVGCPAPAPAPIDADLMFPDGGHDAGPAPIWVEAAPFPVPIAYATANILASGGQRWIFVVGGADADRDSVTTMYSTIYRAELMADGSLGPWELNGDLSLLGMNLRLAQHGAIRLNGEMGEQGIAIAGGDSSAGPIPRVLAGYLDTMGTGTLTAWGAFEPSLASGEAHVLGTFDPLGAHALALIGGFGGGECGGTPSSCVAFVDAASCAAVGCDWSVGSGCSGSPVACSTWREREPCTQAGCGWSEGLPTARVDIALIDVVPPAPTFLAGPPLPAPRVAHRTVQVGTTFFIVGGESATDPHPDVLRSERDMGGAGDVVGWAVAGTIEDPPSDHAAFEIDGEMWVVGGIEGGRDGGLLSTRARHAPIGAGDTVGTFVDAAAYELPVGLADSAVVVDDTFVYMIGGRSVGGLASSTTVLIGRF